MKEGICSAPCDSMGGYPDRLLDPVLYAVHIQVYLGYS